ncbi:hypothetical protein [Enterococcus cecorum]|uniref:hypothetical protein n=1 Tax=Enterococcus cecorum TaxID=44008 RepID=UPI001FABCEB0|nr:hypothetical protein [Enterococcus cecorum]MCJ0574862.1 hypothetical protein [Enterococcus cecorum]
MSEIINVNTLEQLKQFLNDNNILEIVVRGKNKRIAAFQKVMINELPQVQEQVAMENVVKILNKNTLLNERNLKLVGQVMQAQKIGLLLNGMNLCATCAGFAILYEKLDQMSAEITQQLNQLQNVVKQGNDVHSGYEFNKVLSDHVDMLDCRRIKQPYSEAKMRELVDREYNVLTLLINLFQNDIAADKKSTIFSIFSLLSMFTVSLRYFDEIYYENHHEVLEDDNVWHTSHEKWCGIYDALTSQCFIEKLQDYAMFETSFNTLGVDTYCMGLLDKVVELKEEVEDNQELIIALGDMDSLRSLRKMTETDIKNTIINAVTESCGEEPAPELKQVFEDTLQQVAVF